MNSQMKRGTLELCALSVMSRGDCYGYELVNQISKCMEITEGTIYPLMKRLKESGLIDSYIVESTEGPPRKYYKITEAGSEELKSLSEEWFEFAESINKLLKGEYSNNESNE
ncbi:MAG: PadR family transcriptional regulator [Oscillospiraceae bacterium]